MNLGTIQSSLSGLHSYLKKESGSAWDSIEENCFVAGGAIRDTILGAPPSDIDLFVKGDIKKVNEVILTAYHHTGFSDYEMSETSKAATFRTRHDKPKSHLSTGGEVQNLNIQIVKAYSGGINDVLMQFDYRINMAAYDLKSKSLVMGANCDLMNRISNKPTYQMGASGKMDKLMESDKRMILHAGLNFDYLDKSFEIKDSDSASSVKDSITRALLLIKRTEKLSNELGGYGVRFDTISSLTTFLIESTNAMFSIDRALPPEDELLDLDYVLDNKSVWGLDSIDVTDPDMLTNQQLQHIHKTIMVDQAIEKAKLSDESYL
jgi:hypothetical protein